MTDKFLIINSPDHATSPSCDIDIKKFFNHNSNTPNDVNVSQDALNNHKSEWD